MRMIRLILAAVLVLASLPAHAGANNPTGVFGTANQITCSPNYGKAVCSLPANVQVTTSLAIGGCAISTNSLCVTGTSNLGGVVTLGSNLSVGGGNISIGSGQIIAWMAGRGIVSSPAANTIQVGNLDSSGPSAQVLQFQNGAGTNIAAAATGTIVGPLATGTGTNGDLVIQTGTKTSSGSTAATKTTALTIKGETQNVVASALIVTKGYTVAALPTGITGAIAYVTDATACTFLSAPTGGGSTYCPVTYNGSAWVAR